MDSYGHEGEDHVLNSREGHMSGEWGKQEVTYPRTEDPIPKKKGEDGQALSYQP